MAEIGRMFLGFGVVLLGMLLVASGAGPFGLALSAFGIVSIIGTMLGRRESFFSSELPFGKIGLQ